MIGKDWALKKFCLPLKEIGSTRPLTDLASLEKLEILDNLLIMVISFKGLSNTLYPLSRLSYLMRIGHL